MTSPLGAFALLAGFGVFMLCLFIGMAIVLHMRELIEAFVEWRSK